MVIAMYVNIPVRPNTKKILDELRKSLGTTSYDETVKELARTNSFLLIKDLKGILKGTPPFKREKLERDFG